MKDKLHNSHVMPLPTTLETKNDILINVVSLLLRAQIRYSKT